MLQEANESSDKILIVRDSADISQAKASQRLGIVLSLQGASPIGQDLSLLRTFYRLGIRCLHLTANLRNQVSDSCIGRTQGGLTEFGVEVVREMNRLGMVIDIAQLSRAGCMDVFGLTEQPVIASNSNARALCDHPRNLDDETIRRLAESGGVMGIHCLPAFLTKKPGANIANMVEQIQYVSNLVGVNHVGLGPDLLENWPREKYDCIWGSGQNLGSTKIEFDYPEGFEDISKIPNLAASLSHSGFADNEVDKILGGNFLRVFRHVWKSQ
jgi:membrane dipeptidase